MDRETKEFSTPLGHKIVVRTYLTGRESNELKSVLYAAFKMNMDDAKSGNVNVHEIPGTFILDQERKALGLLVVSVDGETAAPLEKLLDLSQSEYDAVVKQVNEITNPTQPTK